jgi:hypothetical protein
VPQLPLIDLAAEGITVKVDHENRTGGSPDEKNFGDPNPATTTRKFFVKPWEKRDIFIRWLLGEVDINTDPPRDTLTRTPPQVHPLYPDMIAVRVSNVRGLDPAPGDKFSTPNAGITTYTLTDYDQSGNPISQDHKLAKYGIAIIDVDYEHVRYNAWGDGEYLYQVAHGGTIGTAVESEYYRYTELTDPKSSSQYLQLPGMTLAYTWKVPQLFGGEPLPPHGTPIPYGIGLVLPKEEFTLIWRRVPYEVMDPLQSPLPKLFTRIYGDPGSAADLITGKYYQANNRPWLGTINKKTFFGYGAGTLLFSGFERKRRSGPIPETFEWDLYYTFTYDPNRGWDRKYYFTNIGASNNGWYYVSRSSTYYDHGSIPDEDSQYSERDFAGLFRVSDFP